MSMLKRCLLLLVATALFASITWSPSHADTRTRTDPMGDAIAPFDLTSATYGNLREAIHIQLNARNLKGITTTVKVRFNKRGMGSTHFYVSAARYPGGEIGSALYVWSPGSDHQLRCAGLRVRWSISQDWIRFTVPQLCLGEGGYGRQRFAAMIGTSMGYKDTTRRITVRYR